MVRILTEDFNELDLAPDYEFQVEMTNPMLDTGHLPEAFSTQIPFPPSPTNRERFGYTPVLMRPPKIQRLTASIWIGGVPFLYGTLVYDGIEDGALLYTFTSKIPDLESKIWDQQILEFTTDNLPIEPSGYFKAPLVIRSANVATQPYLNGAGDDNLWVKYWNYKNSGRSYDYLNFLPAIPVSVIIAWMNLKTPSDMRFLLDNVCVLGRYHEFAAGDVARDSGQMSARDAGNAGRAGRVSPSRSNDYNTGEYGGMPAGHTYTRGSKATDLASFLPDITYIDLLKGIGSMFCCSFYLEGNTLKMVGNRDVLAADPLDWSGKISDKFSAEVQPAATYKFGYAEDNISENLPSLDPRATRNVEAGADNTFNPDIILQAFGTSGNYVVVWDKTTGDIFSGRSYSFANQIPVPSGYSAPRVYDCDIIYHNNKQVTLKVEDEDSETFDNSCGFKLVRCVPEKIFPGHGTGQWPSESDSTFRMTPVVDQQSVSEDRDADVYIGIIDNLYGQMTDHDQFYPKTNIETSLLGLNNLTPGDLFEKRHKTFAEWCSHRRQVVKADINLTPSELRSFRFYVPVYFSGRKWLVKRLSLTVGADIEKIDITADFVEV